MKKKVLLAASLVLGVIALQAQNGTRLIGYDAKTIGRGGTVTGTFDNPSLMMNNPAGISFLGQSQLDINFSLMAPGVTFKNSLNDAEGDKNLFPLPSVWYVHKAKESKLTYGFGLYTQGGMGADFNLNHALFPQKQTYHSKFAVMQGGPSAAYAITNRLSLGLSAHLLYSQMEFQMPFSMPPSMLLGVVNPQTGMTFGDMFSAPSEQGGLEYTEVTAAANMHDLSTLGFAGKIGLAYKPSDKFSFGINYNTATKLHFKDGKADMDMSAQMNDAFGKVVAGIMQQNPSMTPQDAQQAAMTAFSQMGIDLSKGAVASYALDNQFSLPSSLAIGVSANPSKGFQFGLDLEWIQWKKAFDQMDMQLTKGANPNINQMMGNTGAFAMYFPLEWKNTVVVRTGAEFDLNKSWKGRLGYAYGSNPVPSATVFPVFPAIVKHHAMAGLSVNASSKIALNFAYEHAFKSELKATNPSKIAEEFSGSTSGLKTDIFHVSLSWKL